MVCKPLSNGHSTIFLKSQICEKKFQFLLDRADILSLCGHSSIFEFSRLRKIAEKIDKFHAKTAIPYLHIFKCKFLCLNRRFS